VKKSYNTLIAFLISLSTFLFLCHYFVASNNFFNIVENYKDQWVYHIPAVNLSKGLGFQEGLVDNVDEYRLKSTPENDVEIQRLKHTRGYSFYAPSGYVFFLAGIYKSFGVRPDVARFIQILVLILALSSFPYLGGILFGNIGIFVGALSTYLYISFFKFNYISLSPEGLLFFLLTIYAIFWVRWEREFSGGRLFVLGILMACCNIVKGTTVFIPLFSVIYIFFSFSQKPFFVRFKRATLFILGYLILVIPWTIYATNKSNKLVLFSTNWENVLLDSHNEDALVSGKWSPAWRKSLNRNELYFYNRPNMAKQDMLSKFLGFIGLHKGVLWKLYWRKLWYAFGKFPETFYATFLMIFYYFVFVIVKWKLKDNHSEKFKEIIQNGSQSSLPLIYLCNLLLIIIIFHGMRNIVNEFTPFFLIWGLYGLIFLFQLVMQKFLTKNGIQIKYNRSILILLGLLIFILSTTSLCKRIHFNDHVMRFSDEYHYHVLGVNLSRRHGYQLGILSNDIDYNVHYPEGYRHNDCQKQSCYFFGKPPGYPLFLGFIYKIFGSNISVVKIVQCLMLALGAALLPAIGYHYWSKSGILAGVISAFLFIRNFSPDFDDVKTEPFAFFVLLILTIILISWEMRPNKIKVFILGLVSTYLFLIKEIVLFVPFFLIGYICWAIHKKRRDSLKKNIAIFLLGCLLVSLPWLIYSSIHEGKATFFRTAWETWLLDAFNEDVVDMGHRSNLWRYKKPNQVHYFYQDEKLKNSPDLQKWFLFLWHYKKQLPHLLMNKMYMGLTRPQGVHRYTVWMSLYYLVSILFKNFILKIKAINGREHTPVFPLLYFMSLLGLILMYHGHEDNLWVFFYFILLSAIYFPFFILKLIYYRYKLSHIPSID